SLIHTEKKTYKRPRPLSQPRAVGGLERNAIARISLRARTGSRRSRRTRSAAAVTASSGIDKLKGFDDDLEFGSIRAVFVLPGVELQASFDKNRPSLAEEFGHVFGGVAPRFAIDEGGLFIHLAIFALVATI